MNTATLAPFFPLSRHVFLRRAGCALVIGACTALAACGDKDAPPRSGQALASVNGKEITAMQLNDELQRANVQQSQADAATRPLLEALIDRQLLQNEAAKNNTDRDPKVVQAIERAKALIIAQTYMQNKIGGIPKPTQAEVTDYYHKHPDFFVNRKQFDMKQLVIDTRHLTDDVKRRLDASKSLDDVAAYFDERKVKYLRTQASRTTSDLSPEMSARLKTMAKGQLFVVKEGERSMFVSITDVKDNPASLELAAPQIEKFLLAKRGKDAADAELARLRASAKIEYLNKAASMAAMPAGGVPGAAAPAAARPAAGAADEATARGVAGLK
ncbi:MAG: EpsD family peptidyl-prolyl cis-trans isomerase [Pseudomonadota bacterium]